MRIVARRDFLKAVSALSFAALGGRAVDVFAQQDVLRVGVVHQFPIGELGWETQHALG